MGIINSVNGQPYMKVERVNGFVHLNFIGAECAAWFDISAIPQLITHLVEIQNQIKKDIQRVSN